MRCDPEEYLRFADERVRPFHDLLAGPALRVAAWDTYLPALALHMPRFAPARPRMPTSA